MLPLPPRLVFLVVGPAVDVKLSAMHAGLFGRPFALRFGPATFVVATVVATVVGLVVLAVRDELALRTRCCCSLLSAVVIVIKGTYLYREAVAAAGLIAAAVVLIALAVASIVRDLRHAPADAHSGRADTGHGWCGCRWCRSR
jgi:hypothetical protein